MERSNRRAIVIVVLGVVVLAAVVLVGLVVRSDDSSSTNRGTFSGQVAIGEGRVLYLRCAGTGSPTVMLESGAHDSSDTWTVSDSAAAPVFDEVAEFIHVCAYDRPGTVQYVDPPAPALTTRSTPTAQPRSLDDMAADLDALVTAAGIPGPYVLVGHSLGGLVVHLFAQQHPDDTAGVVFVDTLAPALQQLMGEHWAAGCPGLSSHRRPLLRCTGSWPASFGPRKRTESSLGRRVGTGSGCRVPRPRGRADVR